MSRAGEERYSSLGRFGSWCIGLSSATCSVVHRLGLWQPWVGLEKR